LLKKIRKNCKKNLTLLLAATVSVNIGFFAIANANEAPLHQYNTQNEQKTTIQVNKIIFTGNKTLSDHELNDLLPELQVGKKIDINKLSKQIQLLNDTGAVKAAVNFTVDRQGNAVATVSVQELKNTHTVLTVDNTGNEETGDFRTGLSWFNTNLSGKADAFGVSYITSPDHVEQVTQAGVFYRWLLPKAGDSMYVTYSYSDVDMGRIADFGFFSLDAAGKGNSYGIHYQKNLQYMPNERSYIDFGFDRREYDNSNILNVGGVSEELGVDVDTNVASATYIHSTRKTDQAFTYSLGYAANINGNQSAYNRYRNGSTEQFDVFKYGANYQQKYKNQWILNVNLSGQYTDDKLIYPEQLGAGGTRSVRGFDEREVQADKGMVANIEFYSPEIAKGQRFVVFYDYANLSNSHPNTGEIGHEAVGSVGLGWRYAANNGWSAKVDYGFITDDIENKKHDNGKLHFAAAKKI